VVKVGIIIIITTTTKKQKKKKLFSAQVFQFHKNPL